MQIITLRDAVREKFNLESRTVKSAADYMRFYLKLLQSAFEYNLIVQEQRDAIAKVILQAVNVFANNNPILTSNYVYVISMRLLEGTNYEAWCMLEKINSYDTALKFVAESKEYFEKRVESDFAKAQENLKLAMKLRNSHLMTQAQTCIAHLKQIYPCFDTETKLELKKLHTQEFSEITYLPMHSIFAMSYLERIEAFINALFIEISILDKLDAEKILREIAKRRKQKIVHCVDNGEVISLRVSLENTHKRAEKIIDQYQKKMKEIDDCEEAFERVLEKFEKENAHLPENVREELFDDYWTSCPEYVPYDRFEVQRKYENTMRKLNRQIQEYQSRIDELESSYISQAEIFHDSFSGVTLLDVLREYAIFVLANTGQIEGVMNEIDMSMIQMRLPNKLIVEIFLREKADEIGLTQEEKEYLKC